MCLWLELGACLQPSTPHPPCSPLPTWSLPHQELLEFSLVHQAQWAADGDLFDEPGEEGEGGMPLEPPAEPPVECGGAAATLAAVPAST